ncbi:MAG TPA: O-antigen ligase family protein, partial [Candidatus Binatia bacterium]|nr:O-antigen ligase family protein [Candidatus Binatia bacterium]
ILFLLGGFNLFQTQSFGGIILFAASLLFYLLVSGIFKLKYLAPLLMVVALLFFMVVALRFSEARELQPVKLRFVNWIQAGRVIAAAPLFGVGLGNYETAVPVHILPGEPSSIYAHNFFLQMAAETGVPWFLFMLLLSLPWLKKNSRELVRRENALFAALALLVLMFNFIDVGNYFFAAGVGFAVAASQLIARSQRPGRVIFWPLAILGALLLVNEIGADRQKTADLELARRDDARAERHYRQALQLNPWSYRALLGRAAIAGRKGDAAGAEQMFAKVLAIYPGQAYANYMSSQAAFRRGAYLTAMTCARQAAQANKKNKEYQRWHEFIKANFADRLTLPGN